ncbi:CBS domain-containing protein [Parafrankia sp. FMc2]|uniref:CBS domain-containing protein n=1 Tax=Parafrankia sp. FMc2 TaxID=3233196 RepID=UPI0034D4D840
MTRDPQTVEAEQSVVEAARRMRSADAGDVIVYDNGRLGGIVTDRDIALRVVAEAKDPSTTPVREACSPDLTTVEPDTSIEDAVALIRAKAVRRLPVVEGGRAAGTPGDRPGRMRPVTGRAGRVLAVRLDSAGDVLLMGPAIRALAAVPAVSRVAVLAGPAGADAARLLPGVAEVVVRTAPWVVNDPPPTDPADVADVVARVRAGRFDAAAVFTSFHQSPLPTALMLRLAGVPWVAAASVDYPGSLLDLRHRPPSEGTASDVPEAERALDRVRAAGGALPPGDGGQLAVQAKPADVSGLVPAGPYVVVHPAANSRSKG